MNGDMQIRRCSRHGEERPDRGMKLKGLHPDNEKGNWSEKKKSQKIEDWIHGKYLHRQS
jgi:hypothetical protein